MIQFNLLPDVKLEFVKAKRNQRLVIGGSLLLIAVCVFVMIVLLTIVFVAQKKNLSDLDKDIKKHTTELQNTPDLDKILTVQNQLKSLPELHNAKPAATRVYGYIQQMTPSTATVSQLGVDFQENKLTITGNASSLDVVNVFADTLKFTGYRLDGESASEKAPSALKNVVLSQFSRTTTGTTYTITADFDPVIYDIRRQVKLEIPRIVSTRSATQQPTALFQRNGQ
jgi:hypothetical protein